MRMLFAAILFAQGVGIPAPLAAQDNQSDAIRITSAIYGTTQGSATVTPTVTRLAKPGLDEFYAAPQWLEVDPAVGQTKSLTIFYEYRGKSHVLTTTEPGAVSHAILVEHADPAMRRQSVANDAANAVVIVNAYYGVGRTYRLVTSRAREIIRPGGEPFVVDDAVMMVRPTAAGEALIVTYSYQGTRHTLIAWRGERVSHAALVANAESGGPAERYSYAPPAWLQDAQPDPAREPGNPGPGVGRSPRRELGISELLKALAELQAVAPEDRRAALTDAIGLTKRALADAQRNIGYPYPPPSSRPPEARSAPASVHVANAITSLTTALNQLSAATNGPGAAFLARCISEIREALAAFRQEQERT